VIALAVLFFLVIFATLGLALVYFRKGDSRGIRNALTLRVVLAVLFFLLLLVGWYAGWLEPHGLAPR
jgi:hypothetical protein